MGLGAVGKTGNLAIGDEAVKAGLPIGKAPAGWVPLHEGRLVAPIVDVSHGAEVGLAAGKILHRAAFESAGTGPVDAVFVGEDLGGEIAVCALCLLHHRHRGSEELLKELWILDSKPGHNNDGHHDLR